MNDLQATLLLTRPASQSEAFLAECEALAGRRLPVVVSPLLSIEPVGDIPDLDPYATLIVTSANAVRHLADVQALSGRNVATVGESTAELARQHGAAAQAFGENVETFVERADDIEGPALYCRGVHSRGDLAARVRQAGVEIDEVVIYDQVALSPTKAARSLLAGTSPVVAPVFSPRTARLLSAIGPISADLTIIAMSQAVAAAWVGPGKVLTVSEPTSAAMCSLTIGAL